MKTMKDYIEIIPAHEKEGRDWSPVIHSDLLAWQAEKEQAAKAKGDE